jgi:hypothetical protein
LPPACGVHCSIFAGPGAHPVGREQALLEFYDPEKPSTPLRFGDTVSLYPDGVNGLMVYAGSDDGRAWVEILKPTATTPPNMRDCHFRIRPRAQYGEAKRLQKRTRTLTRWRRGAPPLECGWTFSLRAHRDRISPCCSH